MREIEELFSELPLILYRDDRRFKEFTGICPRYMAILDREGKGPERRVRFGKKIGYTRKSLICWINARMQVLDGGKNG